MNYPWRGVHEASWCRHLALGAAATLRVVDGLASAPQAISTIRANSGAPAGDVGLQSLAYVRRTVFSILSTLHLRALRGPRNGLPATLTPFI